MSTLNWYFDRPHFSDINKDTNCNGIYVSKTLIIRINLKYDTGFEKKYIKYNINQSTQSTLILWIKPINFLSTH